MLAVLTTLLVAGSVALFAHLGLRILGGAVAAYRDRYARTLRDPREALRFVERRSLLLLGAAAVVPAGVLGFLLVGPAAGALVALGALFGPVVLARTVRRRWLRRLESQLAPALQAISGALRAGLTFPQAVESVARDAGQPLAGELALFGKQVRLGVPTDDALDDLARRVGSDDLELVVVSTRTARQLGGNLAELLETLAGTMRERFRLEGRIEALTAQGKLQGWIVAAMPLLLGAALDLLRPDLVAPMFRHPFGWGLLGLIVLLEASGLVLIRRIVRIDV